MRVDVPPLYALADTASLGSRPVAEAVREMADAGVEWIQLRAKNLPDDELHRVAEACHRAVEGSSARLWIDDRADLAAMLPFFGVHLGQADLEATRARRVVGEGVAIGCSTHSAEQVRDAERDPAVDVVAFGPIFATRSKENPEPDVGLDALRQARTLTSKPLVAIGGIDQANLESVLETGADSAAMIGAICHGDIGANCRRLLETVAVARGQSV